MITLLRSLAERWSRDLVVRRRLPPQHGGGTIYVSPDASLRFWRQDLGSADPLLLGLCCELVRAGAKVWDIGANVGLFSIAASFHARDTGSVLAVEPDPWLGSLLARSAAEIAPESAAVEVLRAAISNARGLAGFAIARRSRAASHLCTVGGSTQAGGTRGIVEVETLTLDDLLDRYGPPSLVKIDTEGAELLCLQGGSRLLSTARPALLIEVGGENATAVGALLAAARYVLFDASAPPAQRVATLRPSWNTLAIPAETSGAERPSGGRDPA